MAFTKDLSEGASWLQSLKRFGIKPGLQRTQVVLEAFGHPQNHLSFFHIAGTNGKGSVCAYLSSILSVHHSVGVFTSPAFDGYRGRFQVNGASIPDDTFDELALEVKAVVLQLTQYDPLTEFEVLTVMAILYFSRQKVDVVVWETGLGGRFDATNVVSPVVTAITNVGYDHVEILGPLLRDIAFDKAGIAKQNVPMVTAAEDESYRVIERVSTSAGAPVYNNGTAFSATRIAVTPTHQVIHYRGLFQDFSGLEMTLLGMHQVTNLGVALAMYELGCYASVCTKLSNKQMRHVIRRVTWPLRFEVAWHKGNPVVLDGAHNPEGARAFAQTLQEFTHISRLKATRWCMVIGVLADKDISPMLRAILPYAERVILTQPDSPRMKNVNSLREDVFRIRKDLDVTITSTVHQAVHIALQYDLPVACCGSLYTVDEARKTMVEEGILMDPTHGGR